MKNRLGLRLFFCLVVGLIGDPRAAEGSSALALTNVTVIDTTGTGQSRRASVLITDGVIAAIGKPEEVRIPEGVRIFFDNVKIAGGPAPARAYIEELLPDVLEGRIEPGRVFDRLTDLNGVPDGYRAMDDREALKVMIEP